MKKTTLSALVIALAASSAFAAAPVANTTAPAPAEKEHHGPGGRMFEENDTNHDGLISKDEWTLKGNKMFAEMDANHDGKLSKEEIKAHYDLKRATRDKKKLESGNSTVTPATDAAPKH
jgi:Spy/CpxP family protein refolding chaperone